MKRKSGQEIMLATKPEDIFTMDIKTIKEEKEKYIEDFKPKQYKTIENFTITKRVLLLYNEAMAKLESNESWEDYQKVTIKDVSGKEYKIHYISHSNFKLGEMYVTNQYVI